VNVQGWFRALQIAQHSYCDDSNHYQYPNNDPYDCARSCSFGICITISAYPRRFLPQHLLGRADTRGRRVECEVSRPTSDEHASRQLCIASNDATQLSRGHLSS